MRSLPSTIMLIRWRRETTLNNHAVLKKYDLNVFILMQKGLAPVLKKIGNIWSFCF